MPQTYCLLANARKPTFSATAPLGRSVPTGNGIPVFEEMARAFLDTSASNQPRGRLGQFEPGEWEQEHQWQRADEEQSAPSDGIAENDRQDGSHDATGRDTTVDDGVEQIAASRRRELGNHGSGGGDKPTDTDAGEEPQQTEGGDAAGERCQCHSDREPDDVDQHHLSATEVIADRSTRQCADHHSDECIRTQSAGLRCGQGADMAGVVHEYRQDRAVHDQVISVEQNGNGGDGDHPQH